MSSLETLTAKAKKVRRMILKMALNAGGCHLGGAFSCVEILICLYFGGILKYNPNNPNDINRDKFIMSKGHAAVTLYSVLSLAGYFDMSILDTFCKLGSMLGAHPKINEIPGVEATTGALGHGMSFAIGIALSNKLNNFDSKVYVLLGDGECQEGSIWEAALFASQKNLSNLTVIIDYNKLQAMDRLEKIINMGPLKDKWKSFGWDVVEVDGHDIGALVDVLNVKKELDDSPRVVIAHTVKGKGVSFMENEALWHYRLPNEKELEILKKELEFVD